MAARGELGASLLVSYEVTNCMDVTGGVRALRRSRIENNTGLLGRGRRSLDIVAYGPIIGVGVRF